MNKFLILSLLFLAYTSKIKSQTSYLQNKFGKQILNFYNGTYKYTWIRFQEFGKSGDTIYHNGIWHQDGDTLILNSYIKPNNYKYIDFFESSKNFDSFKFYFKSRDIPVFTWGFYYIKINDHYYYLNDSILTLPKFSIKYIIFGCRWTDYPIFFPKKTSDYFEVIFSIVPDYDSYPKNTYFFNEKFLIQDGQLIRLYNNKPPSFKDEFVKITN